MVAQNLAVQGTRARDLVTRWNGSTLNSVKTLRSSGLIKVARHMNVNSLCVFYFIFYCIDRIELT